MDFVYAAVSLTSFKQITNELHAGRAGKGLFTKPSIHWLMKPQEYLYPCFTGIGRAWKRILFLIQAAGNNASA